MVSPPWQVATRASERAVMSAARCETAIIGVPAVTTAFLIAQAIT